MKNLQNNFTTPAQSKRLLELGVPADSADFYYDKDEVEIDEITHPYILPFNRKFSKYNDMFYLPCWSVGRLMEICKICEPKKEYEQLFEELQYSKNYCVVIISHIIANLQIIDFSKLEY